MIGPDVARIILEDILYVCTSVALSPLSAMYLYKRLSVGFSLHYISTIF